MSPPVLSVAENEIKQVYVRQWGMQLIPPLSHANQFFFTTTCSERVFFAVAIYTNFIRFPLASLLLCEHWNEGSVFKRTFTFSRKDVAQQISIHLSPEFFLVGFIPVTSRSRYDNVGNFRLAEHPYAFAQLRRKLLLSLNVPGLNIYCGHRKFCKMLTTLPRIYYSSQHEILTDEI